MQHRRLGEEPHPAGVAPEQDDVAFGQQARLELRAQFLRHVIHLVEVAEGHRHDFQGQGGRIDSAKPGGREQAGIEVARLHQPHHVRLAALRAAGEDDQLHGAVRGLAPLLAHRLQALVVGGAGGGERAELEPDGFVGGVEARREPGPGARIVNRRRSDVYSRL